MENLFLTLGNDLYRFFVEDFRWLNLLKGFGTTLILVIIPIIIGSIVGIGLFLWTYFGSKIPVKFCGILGKFFSLVPVSTVVYISFYLVFLGNRDLGMYAAILVFTLFYMLEVYGAFSATVGAVGQGQVEAAVSMGYSRMDVLKKILLPQSKPGIVSRLKGATGGTIKLSALSSFAAVYDFQAAIDSINTKTSLFALAVIVAPLVYAILILISNKLFDIWLKSIKSGNYTEEEIIDKVIKGKLG